MDTPFTILHAIGGLGIFLLGMTVMTEGLRMFTGNAMRRALAQFTKSPASGVLTGAIATAILQSSSATTVAAIGFVSAGILSFSAAIGIIFGANIGTTATGWLVAILGFKLKLGTALLPLIFVGASLKLFSKDRWANLGYAIAGFGLIFVGIATMQDAMAGVQGFITPARLPMDTLLGRLQLVALGIITTVITQSSSAGVAATLTALHAGAVNFEQAAALVIGMDVGTTVTAIIATLGGPVSARRTGLSHVLYNVWTAGLALLLITPYTWLWNQITPDQLTSNAEIALVTFHTCFNIVGVLTILPMTKPFVHFIIRLIPSTAPEYTDALSDSLLADPPLALTAIQSSIRTESLALLWHILVVLGSPNGQQVDLNELQTALDETHSYVDQIHMNSEAVNDWTRLIHIMHALDHLQRIHERCEEDEDRAKTAQTTTELANEYNLLMNSIQDVIGLIQTDRWQLAVDRATATSKLIHQKAQPYRATIITRIASGQIDVPTGTEKLEAIRWLRRVSKHITRITYHMNQSISAIGA